MPAVSQAAIARVRAYTEGNMDGSVAILRGGPGVLDQATGLVSGMSDPATIYSGKARIHSVAAQGAVSLGPGQIDTRQTTVSIPWSAPLVRRDDLVQITSAGQDGELAGVALRVVDTNGGGLFGECRTLSCTLWGKSPSWDGVG